jgi:hypothetical protein
MFKTTPDGYIFQPPPPTSFHQTNAYVVNESQRAAILAIYNAREAGRRGLLIAVAVAFAAALLLYISHAPGFLIAVFAAFALFVTFVANFVVLLALSLRDLQPILADLPSSQEKLFPDRRRELSLGAPAPVATALYSAGFGFSLGLRFHQHPPFADATSTLLLFGLGLTLFWAFKALRPRSLQSPKKA